MVSPGWSLWSAGESEAQGEEKGALWVSESLAGQGLWGWAPRDCFGVWPGAWLSQAKPGPEFSCLALFNPGGWGETPAGPGHSVRAAPLGGAPGGCPSAYWLGWGVKLSLSGPRARGVVGTGVGQPHSAQLRPAMWTLPALPVFGPCKQEPIRGCVLVSLNLLSTHFLCLATEVLTLTPSPGLGGLSSAHGLDQSHFPGRLSALSQGLELRRNFWKARLTPPRSHGSSPSGAEVLTSSLGWCAP